MDREEIRSRFTKELSIGDKVEVEYQSGVLGGRKEFVGYVTNMSRSCVTTIDSLPAGVRDRLRCFYYEKIVDYHKLIRETEE